MKKLILIFLLIIFLAGCSRSQEVEENLTGIRVSGWYMSEKYQQDIMDLMNFDQVNHTLNVTTLCFDKNDTRLPSNDSEIVHIPARKKITWVPACPKSTRSFKLDIEKIN